MELKPKLKGGLFYAKKEAKHLFLNPAIPDWMILNSNGAFLLSKCDGKTPIATIADSCGAALDDVISLFRQSAQHGIFENKTEESPQKSVGMNPLRIVHWKLTNSCNLRCSYCYATSKVSSKEMSFDDLSKTAHEIKHISQNVDHVLSGGEPLLHPDCILFAEKLKKMGNSVSLLSNGTLINDSNINQIIKHTDSIKISLDGSTEKIHSITRGLGNHSKVLSVIDTLIEREANVQIAMTVHRDNRNDIETMSHKFGSRLTFQPLFPAGRGAKLNELVLTGNEYYEALSSVKSVAPFGSISTHLEQLRGRGAKRCAIADAEISISENGDVYPCQLLAVPEFLAGNIYEKSLKDIYFNSDVLKNLRNISVDTLEKCKDCPIRLLCASGCRARDFYETGKIDEVGDFCEYEQKAFLNGLFDSVTFE